MICLNMRKIPATHVCKGLEIANISPVRQIVFSSCIFSDKKETESFNIFEELRPSVLSEEEIEAKRNKHRLPKRIYKMFVEKEPLPIETEYDFTKIRLRAYYAKFGAASGLNPGILWPTTEELEDMKEYDRMFHHPLKDMLEKIETERLEKEAQKKEVEADVDAKMEKLDKWIADYYDKIEKRKNVALELKKKRENLIEEISEYLGYDIDPKDPRFQEAVAQRDKEKKKAAKAHKQQESYDKMLAQLKKMAEQ